MKIFLLDKTRLSKFVLKEENEDILVLPYKAVGMKKECLITFEKIDNEWYLKSNGIVDVFDGTQKVDKAKVQVYRNYNIKFLERSEFATLYFLPVVNEEQYKLNCELETISIGNQENCNIFYSSHLIQDLRLGIETKGGIAVLKVIANPSNIPVYVNEDRVDFKRLELGDVIFIMGLKIIWMKKFLILNNPNNQVFVKNMSALKELKIENQAIGEVSEEDKLVDLYSEDEYFYHVPRIRDFIQEESVSIDAPPGHEKETKVPFVITMGTSFIMISSVFTMGYSIVLSMVNGNQKIAELIPQFVMFFSMLIGSLIMPRITQAYENKLKRKREKLRQEKYGAYVKEKEKEIQLLIKKQEQILHNTFFSSEQCMNIVRTKNSSFWCRLYDDNDFLHIRFGTGNVPSNVKINSPEKKFSLDSDNLLEMVYKVKENNNLLKGVPVTLPLKESKISSVVFDTNYKSEYLKSLILQLITLHSPLDLKIVVFTNEENKQYWDYLKYDNHCWSEDKSLRYFSTSASSAKNISNHLEEYFKKQIGEDDYKKLLKGDVRSDKEMEQGLAKPYFLLITDNYKSIKDVPIINLILKTNGKGLPISLLSIGNFFKQVPSQSSSFVTIGKDNGAIIEKEKGLSFHQIFKNEFINGLDMRSICNSISNIAIASKESESSLPTAMTFLDMYEVSKIEQLNILNRWKDNDPVTGLNCPIGVNKFGEQFNLNLHEKFHGPHGLVAGMTGSGKSEFIMTYILSMAVNYHPYEVQFVLIDYKGGGLAGAFINKDTGVKLPHLTGTITNLDVSEMNRTLVSINSELKRRQKLFNEVRDSLSEGTVDIYKYQKLYRAGIVKEPLAHLFIISDEFAELKSQQPDFMDELVSTARIGRSLGIHLILATQKPSGVVDDQIWSNSKFKICLKVQDASDSNEMLRNPDAAAIKEAGRFYLQVGYDDFYDMGQSGWAGAKYLPSDKIVKKVDDSLVFIDEIGNEIKTTKKVTIKTKDEPNAKDQLSSIVKYIYDLGIKENIVTNNLWLDSIPAEINIAAINNKYNHTYAPYNIVIPIGEYDDPKAQKQGLAYVDFSNRGNLAIIGKIGSGKENLLNTIIWSIITEHTPDEVNLYMLDYGAEALKMFKNIPHVGEVITAEDGEKNRDLFSFISNQLEIRKELFSDYSGSYKDYCENSGKKLPMIIVIINNYDVFSENNDRLADEIETLYRDGVKYGIVFILTAIATTAIHGRMMENFGTKICLQLANDYAYQEVMDCDRKTIPAKFFGRGLVQIQDSVYEFQTASFADKKEVTNVIRAAAAKMKEFYTVSAKKIPTIPKEITYEILKPKVKTFEQLPVGYNFYTKEIQYFNFMKNRILSIMSSQIDDVKMSFIYSLVLMLKQLNSKVTIFDFVSAYEKHKEGVTIIKESLDNHIVNIYNDIVNNANNPQRSTYIFLGASMLGEINENTQSLLTKLLSPELPINNVNFIFLDMYENYENLMRRYEWPNNVSLFGSVIWLGNQIGYQRLFEIKKLSEEASDLAFEGLGYVIVNGRYKVFNQVIDEVEVEDEE